jgi:NTE family protein
VELMKDRVAMFNMRRDLAVARAQLAGASEEEAEAKYPKIDLRVLDISFDQVEDPAERSYLKSLPTSFSLPEEAVDRLRDTAGELLRQSPEFGHYVKLLNGRRIDAGANPAESSAAEAPKASIR